MEVHTCLGKGFLESVYQEALEQELSNRGIPYRSQCELPVYFKGAKLKKGFVADLPVFDQIIVELKAVDKLSGDHQAQLINYLKAANIKVGLLINFGAIRLEWLRRVL